MYRSLILASFLAAYLWGCGGSEEKSDKYTLITKEDRKAIKSICKCMEPLSSLINRMTAETDTAKKQMYSDSLESKAMQLMPCLENIEKLEVRFDSDDKYIEQFLGYLNDKHPDCLPLFMGKKSKDTVKIDTTKIK